MNMTILNATSQLGQYNKLPVVVLVLLIIFLGLWIFLMTISNQIKKIENTIGIKSKKV